MSEIEYELDLNYNLGLKELVDLKMYSSSQNEKINKQRRINRFVVLIICMLIALLYGYNGNNISSTYFFLMGIVCFILYPWYLNWLYRRTYRKQIAKMNLPVHVWLKINNDEVVTLANGVTEPIPLKEIIEIIELDEYFYIRRQITKYVVIPKAGLKNEDEVRAFLTSIALVNGIRYSDKKGFEWK